MCVLEHYACAYDSLCVCVCVGGHEFHGIFVLVACSDRSELHLLASFLRKTFAQKLEKGKVVAEVNTRQIFSYRRR